MSRIVRTLRARYVFPGAGPPVRDGTVTFADGRIVAVGSSSAGDAEDLGNVALLPGLVNAHTHLELSDLRAPLGEPGVGMVDWIRRVIQYRRSAAETGIAPAKGTVPFSLRENWDSPHPTSPQPTSAVEMGLRESVRLGTTALGEIAQPGWSIGPFQQAPGAAVVFLELIAPQADRVAATMELARQHLQAAEGASAWRPGLSPHAPYSVHPELLRQVVALSAAQRVPLAVHLAESREELELLRTGGGPFEQLLEELGAWNPTARQPAMGPLDYLRMLARADRALVIHGNYLGDEEIALLAENRRRMSVVYCPRTHAWFGHKPYPLERLLKAGAAVALGTDSRASAPDLSILAEMRAVAGNHPAVSSEEVLRLGTVYGARALGLDDTGSLEPGRWADLAVVALPDRQAADPYELIFDSDRPVTATYVRGTHVPG